MLEVWEVLPSSVSFQTMIKLCLSCNKKYYYNISTCIFCFSNLETIDEQKNGQKFQIKYVTEVKIPSLKDVEAPYFVALQEHQEGEFSFQKSISRSIAGSSSEAETTGKKLRSLKVGIIGTGVMGEGIAHWLLQKGATVVLLTGNEEKINRVREKARQYFHSMVDKDKIWQTMLRFIPTTDILTMQDADIVIESITEELKPKQELFAKLDALCPSQTIIATNTSSLSVKDIAAKVTVRGRIAGLHFFNPVRKMKLVEIVTTEHTSPDTLDFLLGFCRQIDKKAVVVNDRPGFIVNRILFPYLLEACHLLESGMSKEDIDSSAQLGLNHPIGPLALIDFIGLDVFLHICQNFFQQTEEEKWKVPKIIATMVQEGKLGCKSKEGFYSY